MRLDLLPAASFWLQSQCHLRAMGKRGDGKAAEASEPAKKVAKGKALGLDDTVNAAHYAEVQKAWESIFQCHDIKTSKIFH